MATPDKYLTCLRRAMADTKGYGSVKIGKAKDEYARLAHENETVRGMGLNDARAEAMAEVMRRLDAAGQEKKDKLLGTAKVLSEHEARFKEAAGIKTWAGTIASKIGVGLKSLVEADVRLPSSNKNFIGVRELAEKRMFGMFNSTIDEASKNWLGINRGSTTLQEFASEIMTPGSTSNPVAKEFAKSWKQRDAFFYSEMKRLGVTLKQVAGEMVFHPAAALLGTREQFIADMKTHIDWNKSGAGHHILDAEKDDWLRAYYDAIRTNKWDALPRPFEYTGGQFARDLANERMIQFKNGESYAAMHSKYMNGDMLYTHNVSTKKLAHNIAVATIYGPSPAHMEKLIIKMAEDMAHDLTPEGSSAKDIDKYIKKYRNITDLALHRNPMDPESQLGMWSTAISNLNIASMLGGSAFLSIPGDIANMIATRMSNHEPILGALAGIPKAITMSKATQREMLLFGHSASEYQNQIVHEARFNNMAEYGVTGIRYVADKTLRMTGMPRGFEAVRAADMMARAKSIFEQRGVSYDQLAEKQVLERWGMTEAEWNTTRKAMQTGNNYSPANDISMFRPYDHADALGPELTQKWQLLFHNEGKRNVIESSLEARAIAMQGLRPDTVAGFFLSSTAKFHSYAITYGLSLARTIMAANSTSDRLAIGARSGLALIILTAMGMQARQYWQGKSFSDPTTTKFWVKAAFSSGVFGYWGDLVSGSTRSDPTAAIVDTLAGPYGKMIGEVVDQTLGSAFQAMDASDKAGSWTAGKAGVHLVDFLRSYMIPQPFFLQPLLQRHIYEPLQEQLDNQLMQQRYTSQKGYAATAGTPYRPGYGPGERGPIIPLPGS